VSFSLYIDSTYVHGSPKVTKLNGIEPTEHLDLTPCEVVRVRKDGTTKLHKVVTVAGNSNLYLTTKGLGKVYLAGPMRGLPHFNFAAFLFAAAHLKSLGFTVVDPATRDLEQGLDVTRTLEEQGFDVRHSLGWDFAQIVQCDGIVLLDGWEKSTGAKAERLVAEMTGKFVLRLNANLELFAEDGWTSSLTWTPPAPKVEAVCSGSVYTEEP
jgi:hypothetical protein